MTSLSNPSGRHGAPAQRVLVIGASGLVGYALLRLAARRGCKVLGVYHSRRPPELPLPAAALAAADVADPAALAVLLAQARPALVFNCAAVSDIAPCDADPAAARRLNTAAPTALASWCRRTGARFVHFSTDQVFDGAGSWYREDDRPAPVHEYGRTKAAAEAAVLAADPDALVIRLALVYGASPFKARSASEQLAAALRRGARLRLFRNEYRTPVLVDDAAAAALALAERGLGGIFHVAGPERVSRLELGRAVAERCGLDPAAIEEADSPGLAGDPPRPLDLSLDTRLTAAAAGFAFKDVRMGLAGVAGPGAP